MKTNYLIYYVLKLITKGQEWQYKNLNGKGDRPKLYFTQLQLIALLISILFVYTKPKGLSGKSSVSCPLKPSDSAPLC